MANDIIFADGFDEYTTITKRYDTAGNLGTGSVLPNIQAAAARTGPAGLRFDTVAVSAGSTVAQYVQRSLRANLTSVYVGQAVNRRVEPSTTFGGGNSNHVITRSTFMCFADAGTCQCSIHLINGGQIAVYRGIRAALLGTTAKSLQLNSWHYVEVRCDVHSTTGRIDIIVDGVLWLSLTSQNNRVTANNYASQIYFGLMEDTLGQDNFAFGQWDIDDVYIAKTGFAGDIGVNTFMATANGDTNNWTPDSGSNYARVNEIPPNDDTSYVTSSVTGDIDLYAFSGSVPAGSKIAAVVVWADGKKTDAGDRRIRGIVKSGGTVYDNGADIILSGNYFYNDPAVWEVDPATSSPWTVSGSTCQKGIKLVT